MTLAHIILIEIILAAERNFENSEMVALSKN